MADDLITSSMYESAVKGRQDFRAAFQREREKVKAYERALEAAKKDLWMPWSDYGQGQRAAIKFIEDHVAGKDKDDG